MRLLLDTHIVLWLANGSPSLPERLRNLLEETTDEICVSVISAWEYGQKRNRYPESLPFAFEQLLPASYRRLDFPFDAHRFAQDLPPIHSDPFDRMLVAHAIIEQMTVVSTDKHIRRYPVPTIR